MIKTGVHFKDLEFWNKRSDELYSQIGSGRNAWMFNQANNLENIGYALGEQSRWRYKKRPDEITQNDRTMAPSSDWRNSKLLFHLIQTMVTLISNQKLGPCVTGIDAFSREAHDNLERDLKMASILKQAEGWYQEVAAKQGISPMDVPVTNDGLRVRLSMKPQLREEMNFELGVAQLLNIYQWDQTDLETIKCDLITNIGGTWIDLDSCMPNIRAINPLNAYCSHSFREDCSDISEGAEIILVPLWKLEAYAKDQFTDWEQVKGQARPYEQIVKSGGFSSYQFLGSFDSTVDYVPILHGAWKESRKLTKIDFVNSKGELDTALDIDLDPNELEEDRVIGHKTQPYEFTFSFKRVLNTEQYYDKGLLEPQMRYLPINNPEDRTVIDPRPSELPCIFSNPNVMFGRSQSVVDQLKDVMDTLQRAIDKYNATLQAYIPQSVEINMDMMSDIKIGGESKNIDQVIAAFERKGILLKQKQTSYRVGPHDSPDAIKVHENNMSQNIERLAAAWQFLENKVLSMAGIAPTELGQKAPDRTSANVNQSMIQGQNNILGGYFRVRLSRFSRVTFQLMLWLKHCGYEGVYEGQHFKIDRKDMRKRLFNMTTEVLPSDFQWQYLQDAAVQAYNAKPREIEFSDLIIIQMGARKNYKQLASYFAEQQRIGRERNDAKEERMIALNNQGAGQAAQLKGQMEIQKIQVKEQLITERTGMETQAEGMITQAELTNAQKIEMAKILEVTNPQLASDYAATILGLDPNLYRKQVNDLVEVQANPPKTESVAA